MFTIELISIKKWLFNFKTVFSLLVLSAFPVRTDCTNNDLYFRGHLIALAPTRKIPPDPLPRTVVQFCSLFPRQNDIYSQHYPLQEETEPFPSFLNDPTDTFSRSLDSTTFTFEIIN